jgi:hypothetical protein
MNMEEDRLLIAFLVTLPYTGSFFNIRDSGNNR